MVCPRVSRSFWLHVSTVASVTLVASFFIESASESSSAIDTNWSTRDTNDSQDNISEDLLILDELMTPLILLLTVFSDPIMDDKTEIFPLSSASVRGPKKNLP